MSETCLFSVFPWYAAYGSLRCRSVCILLSSRDIVHWFYDEDETKEKGFIFTTFTLQYYDITTFAIFDKPISSLFFCFKFFIFQFLLFCSWNATALLPKRRRKRGLRWTINMTPALFLCPTRNRFSFRIPSADSLPILGFTLFFLLSLYILYRSFCCLCFVCSWAVRLRDVFLYTSSCWRALSSSFCNHSCTSSHFLLPDTSRNICHECFPLFPFFYFSFGNPLYPQYALDQHEHSISADSCVIQVCFPAGRPMKCSPMISLLLFIGIYI